MAEDEWTEADFARARPASEFGFDLTRSRHAHWKVTVRSGFWPLIIEKRIWREQVRFYRYRWQVTLAWWNYFMTYAFAPAHIARQFRVERLPANP
jgi:hypothetical protein